MRNRVILFAGISALSLASPAFAQAEPPQATPAAADVQDDTGELAPDNEIIVSARRREESLQDVPQTVNVITSAQVEKLNIRNFLELTSVIPGLTLTQNSAFGAAATVRGVAFNPEAGTSQTVEFYLNDAPLSSNFVFQSIFDIGQFELQRGPQGTLRGRASPSGSFAFTTRRPDLDEAGLVANATLTDIDAYKFDAALNVPIIENVLGVRLAGVIDENQGSRVRSVKQAAQPQFNPDPLRKTEALRASVLFEPADWLTANFMYQTLNSRSTFYTQVQSLSLVTGAPATTPIIRPFDLLSLDDQGNSFAQRQQVYVGNVDVRFAGQRLSYVGGYSRQQFSQFGGSDSADFFSPATFGTTGRVFSDPVGFAQVCTDQNRYNFVTPTNNNFFQCTQGDSKNTTHELRLASEDRIAGIFDYVVGAAYSKLTSPSRLTVETPLLSSDTSIAFISLTAIANDHRVVDKSVFGNLTAHVTDALELSGGLRYIDTTIRSQLQIGTGAPIGGLTRKDKGTIFIGSAKYEITDDFMVYASVGTSRRPGPNAVGNFSVLRTPRETTFMNLGSETSTSYEIGAKTSFLDGRGRFNVSAYRQDFKGYVYRGPSVFFVSYSNVNIGGGVTIQVPDVASFNFVAAVPVRVQGIEAEASFQITDRWSLGVNASYAKGRIRNGTIACNDINRDGIPDTNPARPTLGALFASLEPGQNVAQCTNFNSRSNFAPDFSANVQTEYGFDVTENVGAFVRGLFNFTGSNVADPANAFDDVDQYGLLNLFGGVRDADGAWELSLFAKNVLRERRVLSTTGAPLTATNRKLLFGAPDPQTQIPPVIGVALLDHVSQYVPVSVTAPREFGVSLRVALGSR